MNKTGLLILVGSIGAAVILLIIWFIGVLTHIGGALIHLLLILAMLVGFIGFITGLVVLLGGKKS